MTEVGGLHRYRHIGRFYDVISMERPLYAAPRRHLLSLIGAHPGATVVDVGCGTGLNFAGLRELVGPTGHIVGIDASQSMLAAAQRRIERQGWTDVTTVHGDLADLLAVLYESGLDLDDISIIVATFVLSTSGANESFWRAVDRLSGVRQRLVGVADLGPPRATGRLRRLGLVALASLGGSRPTSQPWIDLTSRSNDAVVSAHLGGHVRLAVGHCPATLPHDRQLVTPAP